MKQVRPGNRKDSECYEEKTEFRGADPSPENRLSCGPRAGPGRVRDMILVMSRAYPCVEIGRAVQKSDDA